MFQDYNLLQGLSAVENVALPLELEGVAAPEARRAALHAMDDLGLVDRADCGTDELSGGEAQRVAMARAIVGGRHLVLADEPTGGTPPEADPACGVTSVVRWGRREGLSLSSWVSGSPVARCPGSNHTPCCRGPA